MKCLVEDCNYKLRNNGETCSDKETCFAFIPEGSRLRDVKFNSLKNFCIGLSIFLGEPGVGKMPIAEGFIGEVLPQVVDYADYKIKSCHSFFNLFVIVLEENKKAEE